MINHRHFYVSTWIKSILVTWLKSNKVLITMEEPCGKYESLITETFVYSQLSHSQI